MTFRKNQREIIIAGNWKMNTSLAEGRGLALNLSERVKQFPFSTDDSAKVTVVICPPYTHLHFIRAEMMESTIEMGAQNIHWEEKGAYTGEISAPMLTEIGCKWAIVGHSERRQFFGETNESVNLRAAAALKHNLRPIICVGESLSERESGATFDVIGKQLMIGVKGLIEILENKEFTSNPFVIAYEPIWAIGTGKTATPEQAEEVHCFIRNTLSEMTSENIAERTSLLYGGSVNAKNASDLLTMPNVDGALVGGASLDVEQFTEIIRSAFSSY